MKHVAIVGAGGIGQRHLQSCAGLPSVEFELHVVEPDETSRGNAQRLAGAANVRWYDNVEALPSHLDLAVIATRADMRARVTREIVETTSSRLLILEKVLFQRADQYREIGELFERLGVSAWVNCPRRLWPAYRDLAARISPERILRIATVGKSWDIGCNAIHFLDLFEYLTATTRATVDKVDLTLVHPAKRQGMLHIEGAVTGALGASSSRSVGFEIVSRPDYEGAQMIVIETVDGCFLVNEGDVVTVKAPGGAVASYSVPFQSQLTAGTVESILATGRCDLASYALSRQLHETLLDKMRGALGRAGHLSDPEVCPVT